MLWAEDIVAAHQALVLAFHKDVDDFPAIFMLGRPDVTDINVGSVLVDLNNPRLRHEGHHGDVLLFDHLLDHLGYAILDRLGLCVVAYKLDGSDREISLRENEEDDGY